MTQRKAGLCAVTWLCTACTCLQVQLDWSSVDSKTQGTDFVVSLPVDLNITCVIIAVLRGVQLQTHADVTHSMRYIHICSMLWRGDATLYAPGMSLCIATSHASRMSSIALEANARSKQICRYQLVSQA